MALALSTSRPTTLSRLPSMLPKPFSIRPERVTGEGSALRCRARRRGLSSSLGSRCKPEGVMGMVSVAEGARSVIAQEHHVVRSLGLFRLDRLLACIESLAHGLHELR